MKKCGMHQINQTWYLCRVSPSHTWQLFLEIQSNFHILVAKQVAKKVAKKLQANCYMFEF